MQHPASCTGAPSRRVTQPCVCRAHALWQRATPLERDAGPSGIHRNERPAGCNACSAAAPASVTLPTQCTGKARSAGLRCGWLCRSVCASAGESCTDKASVGRHRGTASSLQHFCTHQLCEPMCKACCRLRSHLQAALRARSAAASVRPLSLHHWLGFAPVGCSQGAAPIPCVPLVRCCVSENLFQQCASSQGARAPSDLASFLPGAPQGTQRRGCHQWAAHVGRLHACAQLENYGTGAHHSHWGSEGGVISSGGHAVPVCADLPCADCTEERREPAASSAGSLTLEACLVRLEGRACIWQAVRDRLAACKAVGQL